MYEGLKNLEIRTPKHPRARRVARAIMVSLLAVIVLTIGTGTWTYFKIRGNLKPGIDEQLRNLSAQAPGEPLNILVVGSDSRRGITREDRQAGLGGPGGQRADVIMILHIGAEGRTATLVSIPRDLRVEIPGHGLNKINAAYAFGSTPSKRHNLMLRTVEKLTGVSLNHFIDVNFFGFRGIVDAVNGVPIRVSGAIKDDKAKLNIPRAGCWILDGTEALAYVRARQFDPTADIGRISRQQQFLRSLAHRIGSIRVLLNPGKLDRISEHIGEYFRYDAALVGGPTFSRARAIAARLATLDDRKLDFRIVPSHGATIGGISYLIADPEAQDLFEALRSDGKIPDVGKTAASVPKRSEVVVQILNGSGRPGFAARQTERLRNKNFQMLSPGDTKRRTKTVIEYEYEDELKAELVKAQFKTAQLRRVNDNLPGDVVVKLGRDLIGESNPTDSSPAPEMPTPKEECKPL